MTDRDLHTRLRHAVRAEAYRTDPGALFERVLSIPDTVEPEPQRWWHGLGLGGVRGRGGSRGTTTGGSRMFAAMRFAAVAAVLAISGTMVLSAALEHDGTPPVPGAEAPASEWVSVTGIETFQCASATCTSTDVMSDPRVSGDGLLTWESQLLPYVSTRDYDLWGEYTVTNDGGAWQGEWIGFVDADGRHQISWWLRGSDDYEGLSYLGFGEQQPSGEVQVNGLVYPGELPPTVVLGSGLEPAS